MQTSIIISGQISGNSTLKNAMSGNYKERQLMFNSVEIIFNTKKEAKKALWNAFKVLRSDKEDAEASMLSYSKYGTLRYDASIAEINCSVS